MIKVLCIGKLKEDYLKEAVKEYSKRLTKYHKVEIIELPDNGIEEEGKNILNHIHHQDYVITLEIDGTQLDSISLAKKIDNTFISNPCIVFVIGGSYGLMDLVKKRSNYALSFSKLTFPHQLFRIILLEQIYRSFKILNNETYHK